MTKQETDNWLGNLKQGLRQDYHLDSQTFENRLARWGIGVQVALYFSRFRISEKVFAGFGDAPRAVLADREYTNDGQTRLLKELSRIIVGTNPRIPMAQRDMFMRFIFATTAEELVKRGRQKKDDYVVHQAHLTARTMFLSATNLFDSQEQGTIDSAWKNETAKMLSDRKSDLPSIHDRLKQFVDAPPIAHPGVPNS
jgi:hypothetical protein